MRSSKGEEKIHSVLRESGVPFVREYAAPGLYGKNGANLRYDFALLDAHGSVVAFIEFQGEQHYRPVSYFGGRDAFNKQRGYDLKKQQYCRLKNIPLVSVPFTDIDKVDFEYIEQGVKNWQMSNLKKSATSG